MLSGRAATRQSHNDVQGRQPARFYWQMDIEWTGAGALCWAGESLGSWLFQRSRLGHDDLSASRGLAGARMN